MTVLYVNHLTTYADEIHAYNCLYIYLMNRIRIAYIQCLVRIIPNKYHLD
jgi:hypothetical protein